MKDLSWALDFFGILLNFVAGFLFTPEAIGIERIAKAEKHLRHSLVRIIMKMESYKSKAMKAENDIRDINISVFFLKLKKRLGMPF